MSVVEAAFVMVGAPGMLEKDDYAQAVEAAMIGALREALAEGVSDPEELKRRMLAARDAV